MPDGRDRQTTKRLVIAAMAAGLPWEVACQQANAPIGCAALLPRPTTVATWAAGSRPVITTCHHVSAA